MNHKRGIKPRALIVGISGQDGAYLSKFLIEKGYHVFGTSRDIDAASFDGLKYLGVDSQITKMKMVPSNFEAVCETISLFSLTRFIIYLVNHLLACLLSSLLKLYKALFW